MLGCSRTLPLPTYKEARAFAGFETISIGIAMTRTQDKKTRPVDTEWIVSPRVKGLKHGYLYIDPASSFRVRAPRDLLDQFLKLADGEPGEYGDILRFAKKYGALGVRADGWRRHSRLDALMLRRLQFAFDPRGAKAEAQYRSLLAEGQSNREPAEGWRRMAKRLKSAVTIGIGLNQRLIGEPEDWAILAAGRESLRNTRPWERNGDRALAVLRGEFETFMRAMNLQFGVTLRFSWGYFGDDPRGEWKLEAGAGHGAEKWKVDFDAGHGAAAVQGIGNLGGILVIQAMMRIADRSFAICSHHHGPYQPGRLPPEGGRNYCDLPPCKRAAWNDSKARRKAQRAQSRRWKS